MGAARKPPFKEQVRTAIDGALAQQPGDLTAFLSLMEKAGVEVLHGRGGVISFRLPGQDRATRWRGSTLGSGYGPEDVQAVIDGRAPARPVFQGGAGPPPGSGSISPLTFSSASPRARAPVMNIGPSSIT